MRYNEDTVWDYVRYIIYIIALVAPNALDYWIK